MPEYEYPEHEKLRNLQGRNNLVGDFIEWLQDRGMVICERTENQISNLYMPVRQRTEWFVAEFFDIDQKKLEAEKQQMLAKIRERTQ